MVQAWEISLDFWNRSLLDWKCPLKRRVTRICSDFPNPTTPVQETSMRITDSRPGLNSISREVRMSSTLVSSLIPQWRVALTIISPKTQEVQLELDLMTTNSLLFCIVIHEPGQCLTSSRLVWVLLQWMVKMPTILGLKQYQVAKGMTKGNYFLGVVPTKVETTYSFKIPSRSKEGEQIHLNYWKQLDTLGSCVALTKWRIVIHLAAGR